MKRRRDDETYEQQKRAPKEQLTPTQYNGVYLEENGRRYRAQNNKQILGLYSTAEEAAVIYDRSVLKQKLTQLKTMNRINFPNKMSSHNLKKEPIPLHIQKQVAINNATGFRGVTEKISCWQARIGLDDKLQSLGYFDTAKEAAVAFDKVSIEKGGWLYLFFVFFLFFLYY